MDLATIIQQIAVVNNQQAQQAGQISDLMAGASKEAAGIATNVEKAGQLSADAELVRLQGELNTQNARVKAANAFGTNVNAQSDVITSFAEQMRMDAIKLVDAQKNVSRIEAGSDLLGNPMGWLEDLLTGDGARAERDALAAAFDTKSKLVQNLNAATQSTVATQNAISETLTTKSIKDLAQAKLLTSQNEAAEARIAAAKYGVASIEALQAMGSQNFNRTLAGYNAIKQDEQWRLARADRLEAQKERKAIDKDLSTMLESVNTFRQTFGQRPLTAEYVKRNWNDVEFRRSVNEMEQAGWRIQDNGGSTEGVLGSTPAQTWAAVSSGQIETPPSWKPSVEVLDQSSRILSSEMQAAGAKDPTTGMVTPTPVLGLTAKITDSKVMQDAYNKIVDNSAKAAQSLIKPDTGNPYEIPPISNIFESPTADARALRDSAFGRDVLGALVQTGVPKPTPQLVIATALEQVDQGKLSFKDANDGIGAYFEAGLGVVNATGGFTTTNVPTSSTYNVSIEDLLGERVELATGRHPLSLGAVARSAFTATLGLPSRLLSEPTTRAPKRVFNLLDPQDRTTILTILNSKRQSEKFQAALKGQQP